MSTQAPSPKQHDIRDGNTGVREARCRVVAGQSIAKSLRPNNERTGPGDELQYATLVDDTNLAQRRFWAPLAVPPRQACQLLCVGLTRLYELLHTGELESYRHGRSRRITIASIRAYIARHIEASSTLGPPP
jgi:excisionase family DNA binding protein